MPGFRSPLFHLGLSSAPAVQAGFRGPLPAPQLSGSSVQAGFRGPLPVPPFSANDSGVQAGFRNPLPIPPISGEAVGQAGFIGPIPIINLSAPPANQEIAQGGDLIDDDYWQIQQEDEILLTVIAAFIEMIE